MLNVIRYDDPENYANHDTLYDCNWEYIEDRAVMQLSYDQSQKYRAEFKKLSVFLYEVCNDCYGEGCEECEDGWKEADRDTYIESTEYEKALGEVETELYDGWKRALMRYSDDFAEYVALVVLPVRIRRPYEVSGKTKYWHEDGVEIKPQQQYRNDKWVASWKTPAEEFIGLLEYSYYEDATEMLREEGWKSYKEYVLDNLESAGHQYKRVTRSGKFDGYLDHYLYNW